MVSTENLPKFNVQAVKKSFSFSGVCEIFYISDEAAAGVINKVLLPTLITRVLIREAVL